MTNYQNYRNEYGPPPGGQLPPFPSPRNWPPTRPEPPREVRTAFTLWVSGLVIGVISGALSFVWGNPLDEGRQRAQADATSQVSRDQLDTIFNVVLVIALVFAVVFIAVEVLFMFKMKAGRNWARIVLTVLTGFTVLLFPLGVILQPELGITDAVGAIQVVLMVTATVFMFRAPANDYFAGRMN